VKDFWMAAGEAYKEPKEGKEEAKPVAPEIFFSSPPDKFSSLFRFIQEKQL
jgi:hypothetical protein